MKRTAYTSYPANADPALRQPRVPEHLLRSIPEANYRAGGILCRGTYRDCELENE